MILTSRPNALTFGTDVTARSVSQMLRPHHLDVRSADGLPTTNKPTR